MLYEDFCGFNLNLIKAGVVIGIVDILSSVYEIAAEFKIYVGCEFIRFLFFKKVQ